MFISKSFFVSRAFVKFGAKRSSHWAFGLDDVFELFLKTALRHWAFSCELRLGPRVFFFNFHSFFKQSRCYLPDSYGDPQAEQRSLVMVRRKLEWKLDFRALARSRAEGPSIVVAISTSRLLWSMVQKRQKPDKVSVSCDCPLSSTKAARKPASFAEPVFETWCFYRFALRCFRVRGCTVARRSGCRSGPAKKSSHPWHFRCWSPERSRTWVHQSGSLDGGMAPFFVTWCNYRSWFCVRKALFTVFLPKIKKKKTLSNVGHQGTKAENFAWHWKG